MSNTTKKEYVISEEVLQNTLNYLASKPFNEVAQLITMIQQSAKPLEVNKGEEAPADE